jgi:MFS family permease
LALGIYGLTQAALQVPFGIASDHWGCKPVMTIGLTIFTIGSFFAGSVQTLPLIIAGRAIQGRGAISAAISAMIADATREQHRTKAIALVGMMIDATFIVSLTAGPALYRLIGVPGIFLLTGVLAVAAIGVVRPLCLFHRFQSCRSAAALPGIVYRPAVPQGTRHRRV